MPVFRGGAGKRRHKSNNAKPDKEEEERKEKEEKEAEEKKKKEEAKKAKKKLRRSKSARARLQGNSRRERLKAEDWAHSKTDADVPTLPQEQKTRMNKMLIDTYLDDFSDDMEMMFVLLKKLQIENEKLLEYEQVLLDCETRNVEKTFSKRFDLLGKNRKPSATKQMERSNLLELFGGAQKAH